MNFSELLSRKAVRSSEYTLKLVVEKEVVRNDQHVSREASVSRFPFIFVNLSGISILLNHMSSQGVFSEDIYHVDLRYQNNIV